MPTDVINAMETGFDSVKSDIMNVVLIAVPTVLGILALTLGIKFGIKFFKGSAKSAG